MIRKLKNKKILLSIIPIALIASFVFLGNKPEKIETKGMSINSNEKQYLKTEKDVEKLNLKYSTNTNDKVELKIYDPYGNLKDSGTISNDCTFEKEFSNIEGQWIVEITPSTNDNILVESTITKKLNSNF
ncbi:hypothetical protein SAMN04487886_101030 [Clostridium sp. DSM 8431]|uniref:hypothetical protein n=1 Tax=Clostridium sp. DSM 8431 TaxID=1761781 RepID=UPI0008E43E4C|nr:hypothetical protein [Clostridium sp. DSM 8431]SFU34706.1 hypothetical protein SAMN04487886_101030 [Clostridium sp. DSM 8431]